MKEVMTWLFGQLTSVYFWEDGRVMIVTSLIVGIMAELMMWKIINNSQKNWMLFIPTIFCLISLTFGVVMLRFPNGTGGVTQHFYLGMVMYSLAVFLVSGLAGGIMIFLKGRIL